MPRFLTELKKNSKDHSNEFHKEFPQAQCRQNRSIDRIASRKRRRRIAEVILHRSSVCSLKMKLTHGVGANPKAFAFAKPGKLQRQATRSHDVRYEDWTCSFVSLTSSRSRKSDFMSLWWTESQRIPRHLWLPSLDLQE